MMLYNNFYKVSFPISSMEFRRKVFYGGLLALVGFVVNLGGNMIASCDYSSVAGSLREFGRQADKKVVGFEEAGQFADLNSPQAQNYRARLDALKKEAEELHTEAVRCDNESAKYLRRAFLVGYFSG